MVKDFVQDNREEYGTLVISAARVDDDYGFVCDAEDEDNSYMLYAPDGENIKIEYIGTK